MVLPASGCSSRWLIEPIHLETFPQRHTRSMQHDPQIAIGDRQNRANLLARHIVHFTHVKTSRTFCGSFARQSRIVCQNSARCITSSGSGFHSCGPLSWSQKPTDTNFSENSSARNSMSVNEVSRPSLRK